MELLQTDTTNKVLLRRYAEHKARIPNKVWEGQHTLLWTPKEKKKKSIINQKRLIIIIIKKG